VEHMPRRRRLFAPGLPYHVVARGNHRDAIFLHERDYRVYVRRMVRYRNRYGVGLFAYCLMPNHVHFLLRPAELPLGKFMQGLQQSYTQYFNRVYGEVGHLFQGRYKAFPCRHDGHLLAVLRYIHQNPVRARMVARVDEYTFSSHHDYLAGRRGPVVDADPLLRILGGRRAYRAFMLERTEERLPSSPHDGTRPAPDDFPSAESPGPSAVGGAGTSGDPSQTLFPLSVALDILAGPLGVPKEELRGPDRSWEVSGHRTALCHVLVRGLGYRVRDVAAFLGREPGTVSVALSRRANRLLVDGSLRRRLARLSEIVKIVGSDPERRRG